MIFMHLLVKFAVVWQKFYEFVGNASGIENFFIEDIWIADTLFCEVSLTSLLADVHFVPICH